MIFLSSDEVYSGDYQDEIIEETPTSSAGLRADTIAQAEEICDNFRRKRIFLSFLGGVNADI